MDNKIEGKIISKFPAESGTSARGEWKKQKFLVETVEQYPRKVCIDAWTNVIPQLDTFNEGDTVSVSVNIESREFNGRWYTDVRAWRLDRWQPGQTVQSIPAAAPVQQPYAQPAQPQAQPVQPQYQPAQPTMEQPPFGGGGADDLPF